jgi:hypothetical protein
LEVAIAMVCLYRFRTTLLAAALLALALPARAAEVDKFLPNDTEVILTLNVRQILDSPLVKKYGQEPLKMALKSNDEAQRILQALGFDPFTDLTSITATSSGGKEAERGLLIIHGKFDTDKFHAHAEKIAKDMADQLKIHKVGNHKLYETKVPDPMGGQEQTLFIALATRTTIVGAPTRDYVLDALAKAEGKKQTELKKEIQTLLEKADANQSMWMLATGSSLAKSPLAAADEKVKETLGKIASFTGGLTITDEIKAELVVGAMTPDAAKELATEISDGLTQAKGFATLLAGGRKELAAVGEILETIKSSRQGSLITIKGQVTKEVIDKALKMNK